MLRVLNKRLHRLGRPLRSWVLLAAAALGGCGGGGEPAGNGVGRGAATTQPAARVSVELATPEAVTLRIPVVGTLFAAEEAIISTKAAGILRRTFVDVGHELKPGDPLTQVDTVDYEMAERQAEAALAEALARLGTADVPAADFNLEQISTVRRAAATLANARFTHDRLRRLGSGSMAAVSEQELNDAETALRVAEANLRLANEEAAALVALARERQAQLKMAQQRLADARTVTPPIPSTLGRAGATEWVIAERFVTEGQYVNAGDQLYRLIVRDPLKLRSKVPERYAGDARLGQTVELQVVGVLAALRGRITRISPVIEPASRTFEIEALVDNPEDAHKPGSFATGEISAPAAAPTILIPADAVIRTGGATRVFIVRDGRAERRALRLGRTVGDRVEALSGLGPGDAVVVRGAATLVDGAGVQIQKEP